MAMGNEVAFGDPIFIDDVEAMLTILLASSLSSPFALSYHGEESVSE